MIARFRSDDWPPCGGTVAFHQSEGATDEQIREWWSRWRGKKIRLEDTATEPPKRRFCDAGRFWRTVGEFTDGRTRERYWVCEHLLEVNGER